MGRSPALGRLSPSNPAARKLETLGRGLGCYQRSGGRLAAAARESSARRGVSSTNRPERGSGGGFNRPQQPHSFTTLNREKNRLHTYSLLPGRERRSEGSEGAGRLDHSFSSSTLLARSKVTDLRGGRNSNLVPLSGTAARSARSRSCQPRGAAMKRPLGSPRPGRGPSGEAGTQASAARGGRGQHPRFCSGAVTGFPKSAQTREGRAGTPLQSSSISGAAPPGPSSSFQHSRCPGRTQSLAAAGPILTFSFGPRSPAPERPREPRLRSRVPGAPNPLSGGGCG